MRFSDVTDHYLETGKHNHTKGYQSINFFKQLISLMLLLNAFTPEMKCETFSVCVGKLNCQES